MIAGSIKGKLVECPPGEIRPMTSKVKEALFDILRDITGYTMLDLFSGSGNISIEAFSRGISQSDLIEADPGKKKVILKNLESAGFKTANLIIADAITFCKRCTKQYDFIMVDPPFRWEKKAELLKVISGQGLLKKSGSLVIHLQKKEKVEEQIGDLVLYDTRTYGLNMLLFYRVAD